MSVYRRKYLKEFKMEMVEAVLSSKSPLALGKENDIELRKLKIKVCKLEQMVGKLTMEKYILKKEKEYIARAKKESSSIITGANLDRFRRHES